MRIANLIVVLISACALSACGAGTDETGAGAETPAVKADPLSERDQVLCTHTENLPPQEEDEDGAWDTVFLMMSDWAEDTEIRAVANEYRTTYLEPEDAAVYPDRILKICAKHGAVEGD
ncbi:hypothetical protein ACFWQC_18675 [Nocardioides sp. NPDC058538]|uniref:hypothetical protein n=1 Tax=Nocardioides sp. NPDC058538 TaxID=3346542 RepID=UPI00365C0922